MTAWLAGSLALARLPGSPARTAAAAAAFLAEEHALPPLGLLADVAALLHGEPLALLPSPRLPAVLAYEDQLLGRLAAERLLLRASDATLRLPPRSRPRAVAHVTAALLARLGVEPARIPPSAARAFLADPRPDPAAVAALLPVYEALAAAARRAGALLDEGDLAPLEHPALLESAAQRLAARQVLAAVAALDAATPRRRPGRTAPGALPVDRREGAWPAGGYAAIAPGSDLESLVPSELVYMDDGPGPDLFTLRWAEGDLLTYVRDESLARVVRRRLVFALGPELAAARFRHPGEPWQRIIAVLGALLVVARRLRPARVEVEVCFLEPTPLAAERELCRLLDDRWHITSAASAPAGAVLVAADPAAVLEAA